MSSRDHPFNRSTRPLLERRQIIPPKPEYKVHGFNDFKFVAKQYKELNSSIIGYPYGNPPSPTITTDFVFSDDSGINADTSINSSNLTENGSDNYHSTFSTNNYIKQYRWIPDVASSPPQTMVRYEAHRTTGPFIFGIDTNKNEEFTHNKPETVIETNSQYSNLVDKTSCNEPTSSEKGSSPKKCFFKRNRKRNKALDIKDDPQRIKCVVVGDGAVGKTNLILSYLENKFIDQHIPTASDIYNFEVKVNDTPVLITLCDTAGQDSLDELRQLSYPDCDVFLLCFSVIKPETFQAIKQKWAPTFCNTQASLLLVGTQSDLRSDPHVISGLKKKGLHPISLSDAWDLATSLGAEFIETSSRNNLGVKDAFDTAIWDALRALEIKTKKSSFWRKLLCLA